MRVERINDSEGFRKRKNEWNRLLFSTEQNDIFLTHEWFISWWKCFSEGNSLEVLVFKDDNGNPFGIAPFMQKDQVLRFIASQEVTDYCDVITTVEKREEFYESLFNYIRINYSDIKAIECMNIKFSSPTLIYFPSLAKKYNFTCSVSATEVTPVLDLPQSYEDYINGLEKKKRHEIRRKLRRMESLTGIKVEKITDPLQLQSSINTFISLHKESSPLKEEFWDKEGMPDFFHEVTHQFSLMKWIELNLLFFKDKIIAALLNFSYLDRIYFYNVAFDRNFSHYSPGIFLFNSSIREAIKEKKRKADFLRGREKYKYYFGAKESKIFHLVLTPGLNEE